MITKQDVEQVLAPALDLLEDEKLRSQIVDAWVMACEQGGWQSTDDLQAMPFTLLVDTKRVSFIEHVLAVTMGAVGLARAQMDYYREMPYPIDMDRLVAAGLLHDVGKLVEIQRTPDGTFVKSHNGRCTRHPISGTIIAAKAGLPDEVLNTIACHSREGDGRPQVVETVFVHQADFGTFNPLQMMGSGKLIT